MTSNLNNQNIKVVVVSIEEDETIPMIIRCSPAHRHKGEHLVRAETIAKDKGMLFPVAIDESQNDLLERYDWKQVKVYDMNRSQVTTY